MNSMEKKKRVQRRFIQFNSIFFFLHIITVVIFEVKTTKPASVTKYVLQQITHNGFQN